MVKGFFDELGCQQSRSTTPASPSGDCRAIRWSTRNATRARRRRWSSTGSTTPCRSRSPTPGSVPPFDASIVAAGGLQEGAGGSRRDQLQGAGDVRVQRADVDQGGPGQAARERDLRRGGRRGAHGHRSAQLRARSSGSVQRRRHHDRAAGEFGRLRLHPADHQRKELGPRTGGIRHSRLQQALGRQPGVAAHQDAGVAGFRRRQHAADQGLEREQGSSHSRATLDALRKRAENADLKTDGNESRRGALHRRQSVRRAAHADLRKPRSTWTASGAATCTPTPRARFCPTRSRPSTTSATCRT